ncbi:MAG TPA: barstar family protein [Candidatus Limnocylindrales bacterium]|nr:barstar family protein [Candidatus Limnocylindrales bacterium]
MKEIVLEGAGWKKPDDVYDAFFRAVGAPRWHGRNFNALRDSIGVGRINTVEVPYVIRLKSYSLVGPEAKGVTDEFVELIKGLRNSGCPVDISVED